MAKRIHKMIHFIQNQQIDALLIKSKTMKTIYGYYDW